MGDKPRLRREPSTTKEEDDATVERLKAEGYDFLRWEPGEAGTTVIVFTEHEKRALVSPKRPKPPVRERNPKAGKRK